METPPRLEQEQLREVVADALDVNVEELTDQALFVEDLGVDSLVALELAVTLERCYSVKIEESEIITIRRFPDIRALLVAKLGG